MAGSSDDCDGDYRRDDVVGREARGGAGAAEDAAADTAATRAAGASPAKPSSRGSVSSESDAVSLWQGGADVIGMRIRSVEVLTGFPRPAVMRAQCRGAGVLPYAVHPHTRQCVCLVGRLTYSSEFGTCADFGGGGSIREPRRRTAAREATEETEGALAALGALGDLIADYRGSRVSEIFGGNYSMFLVRVPYADYPEEFAKIVSQKRAAVAEKLARGEQVRRCHRRLKFEMEPLMWVPLAELRAAVTSVTCERTRVARCDLGDPVATVAAAGAALGGRPRLYRACFLRTLAIAEAAGVLAALQETAHLEWGGDVDTRKDDPRSVWTVGPDGVPFLWCRQVAGTVSWSRAPRRKAGLARELRRNRMVSSKTEKSN